MLSCFKGMEGTDFRGAVVVAFEGEIILVIGYGSADDDLLVPNTPDIRFHLHWITMQFTTTATLMLREEARLDLQESVFVSGVDLVP
ncbi:MAG: hypothetical protein PVI78_10000 [Anaerolineales bacterium]|jgi:CubicO group peptidase (beta-lactamase class C family)